MREREKAEQSAREAYRKATLPAWEAYLKAKQLKEEL